MGAVVCGGPVVATVAAGMVLVHHRVRRPILTLSAMLFAIREGDFLIRACGAPRGDALGEVMIELNCLIEALRAQRLGALEATTLLRTVMSEIDVAVFAFDDNNRLRLANCAAVRLLGRLIERLVESTAAKVGLADSLSGESVRTFEAAFPGGVGLWGLRRTTSDKLASPTN